MSEQRKYDEEYKKEAVKLANKIGSGKAADELGIPKGTLYGWMLQIPFHCHSFWVFSDCTFIDNSRMCPTE